MNQAVVLGVAGAAGIGSLAVGAISFLESASHASNSDSIAEAFGKNWLILAVASAAMGLSVLGKSQPLTAVSAAMLGASLLGTILGPNTTVRRA